MMKSCIAACLEGNHVNIDNVGAVIFDCTTAARATDSITILAHNLIIKMLIHN